MDWKKVAAHCYALLDGAWMKSVLLTIRIIKGLRRSRMIYFLSRKGERDSSSEGLGNV